MGSASARRRPISALSLKIRLGIGAALLGAGTLFTAFILYSGLNAVAVRLDTALASEARMARYATLSQQAATFLVVATEMVQTGQPAQVRRDRIAPVTDQLRRTFAALQADTEAAVEEARSIGLDAQSRYATQSLGLARMQAMLDNTAAGLDTESDDAGELRAYIDNFATSFDPLLSQAVNAEQLFRTGILRGIDDLRRRLMLTALVIAAATVVAVAAFYFGLVRPQFARLDRLRDAAQRIGQEDFVVSLPVTRMDEIGRLASETERTARALGARKAEVQAEWARLNETIAERTEALRAANASLEEIDANRRRFFADVSHELRTPLTVILMEAQIGRRSLPEAAEAFATIETRAARLNRRIDDLLRVARSDSGQLELDLQPVAVAELLGQAVDEVRAEVETAGMALALDPSPDARLLCDANWLRQVLVGVIRNAIRHARDGGTVRLRAEARAEEVILCVLDHGPGIPEAELPRIFERFAQGGGSAKGQGFGLGLALARWVIETQGGTISAVSPLPDDLRPAGVTGTMVAVCLPRAPA